MGLTIDSLVKDSHANAVVHGWWDGERNFGELLALIHSEVSEALEEYRKGRRPDESYITCAWCSNGHCVSNDSLGKFCETARPCQYAKPEGIPSEFADIVIRVADLCGYYGINLEAAIAEKHAYNINRPYKHGKKI